MILLPLGGHSVAREDISDVLVLSIELDKKIEIEENSCVEITMYDVASRYSNSLEVKRFDVLNHQTTIELPLTGPVVYGRIQYLSGGILRSIHDSPVALHMNNGLFILERGDSVHIYLRDRKTEITTKVEFSGRSADKYRTIFELNEIPFYWAWQIKAIDSALNSENYELAFSLAKKFSVRQCETCLQIINGNESLSPQVRELLLIDCRARFSAAYVGRLESLSESKYRFQLFDKVLIKLAETFNDLEFVNFSLKSQVGSYHYVDYLFNRELLSQRLLISDKHERYNNGNRSYKFHALYEAIVDKYNGPILDKLLMLSFIRLMNSHPDTQEFWNRAESLFTSDTYKKHFLNLKVSNEEKFELALEDENKRIWQIDDFKGRLVLVDFWFTGCAGCIALAKELKPIKQAYVDEGKDILFVNVCIDEQRERWKNSLIGGQYTADFEINLWTEGQGRRHPLIEKYGIFSYPTLYLISPDGKLLARSLPLPISVGDPSYKERFMAYVDSFL